MIVSEKRFILKIILPELQMFLIWFKFQNSDTRSYDFQMTIFSFVYFWNCLITMVIVFSSFFFNPSMAYIWFHVIMPSWIMSLKIVQHYSVGSALFCFLFPECIPLYNNTIHCHFNTIYLSTYTMYRWRNFEVTKVLFLL